MANLKASIKDIRKTEKRRQQNQGYKTRMKKSIRVIADAVKAGETKEKLAELVSSAYSAIDKSVKINIIHKNNAARKKSKLAKVLG